MRFKRIELDHIYDIDKLRGTTVKHPLLNPDSKHYDKGEKPAIQLLEEEMNLNELIGWAYGNIRKYELRRGYKDNIEKEDKKIFTYKKYLSFLLAIDIPELHGTDVPLTYYYKVLDINVDYLL